ncbi:MAG: hypothetical protein LBV28_04555 [Puniceicoccales bacterium]|jgi:hypothetical protein|nr:hypothetical protein [Puniceicoccales bacterium]
MLNKTNSKRSLLRRVLTGRAIGNTTAILAGVLLLSGCTTRIGDFSIISTKNMDLNNPYGFAAETNRLVEGEDVQHYILFIPTQAEANLKEAVDRAIERQSGCVGLSNAVVYVRSFWFLYGQYAIVVKGDPIFSKAPVNTRPADQVLVPQSSVHPQYVQPVVPVQPQYAQPVAPVAAPVR